MRQRHWRSEVWCVRVFVGAAREEARRRVRVVSVRNMVNESRLEWWLVLVFLFSASEWEGERVDKVE